MTRKALPPLTALRSFEAAARNSSFKFAAEELCVSHSAISHQIKILENFLCLELFTRKARCVELTKPGKSYYPVVRDALDSIAEGTAALLSPQAPGVLTLQLYSTFAIRWLIPRLFSFHSQFPEIEVRLSTSQKDVNFEYDDVDLCVLIGAPTSANLHYDFLFKSELLPVASPEFIESVGAINTPADLAKHPILQVYPSARDWSIWLQQAGAEQVNPESGLQFDSYDHALLTAAQGLGVALGTQPYIDRDLKSGALVELFPDLRMKTPGEWYLACRQGKAQDKKVLAFRQWLLEEIKNDPALQHLK